MTPQLTTTGNLAESSGVKAIIYGAPGCGKTPLVSTASNALYVAIERGQISLKGTSVPAIEAYTLESFYQFFEWFDKSSEARQYDTIFIDSISHLCSLILEEELSKTSKGGAKVNGQAAYGEMASRFLKAMNKLYAVKDKNIIMLAQQDEKTDRVKPFFHGNEINVRIPHLFDGVFHLGMHNVPEVGERYSLQMRETPDTFARCRFNVAADYEAANLDYLLNKLNGV